MKEQKENGKNGTALKGRKFYLYVTLGCLAVLLVAAIVATSVALAGHSHGKLNAGMNNSSSSSETEDSSGGNKPVTGTPEEFGAPVAKMNVTNGYEFFENTTLHTYYFHQGVDFAADAGAEVFAVASGKIESIYTSDVLVGTQIIVDHGDGRKSVYEFVSAKEGLKVGDEVKKGDVIATVSEPTGNEYKDGAHLHFEVLENGENIDPAKYLTLEEK